jgi:hypothetical protein
MAGREPRRGVPALQRRVRSDLQKHIELVKQGTFPVRPAPAARRTGSLFDERAGPAEFASRSERVVILAENGPNILRIYTTWTEAPGRGRPLAHLQRQLGRTLEGDTLIFTTALAQKASAART